MNKPSPKKTLISSTDLFPYLRKWGAFPLAQQSADAALIIVLSPGIYTLHLRGANNSTGEALVEVYELR